LPAPPDRPSPPGKAGHLSSQQRDHQRRKPGACRRAI
jgi:hypothetical protein